MKFRIVKGPIPVTIDGIPYEARNIEIAPPDYSCGIMGESVESFQIFDTIGNEIDVDADCDDVIEQINNALENSEYE